MNDLLGNDGGLELRSCIWRRNRQSGVYRPRRQCQIQLVLRHFTHLDRFHWCCGGKRKENYRSHIGYSSIARRKSTTAHLISIFWGNIHTNTKSNTKWQLLAVAIIWVTRNKGLLYFHRYYAVHGTLFSAFQYRLSITWIKICFSSAISWIR